VAETNVEIKGVCNSAISAGVQFTSRVNTECGNAKNN